MATDPTNDVPGPAGDIRVRRVPKRARYDEQAVREIVDAALIAHVGTVRDGRPVVIPMLCVRDGEWLLLHGAPATGSIRRGRAVEVCVTMTLLDGLVLARSAFHHSLNYRSVVVIGTAEIISDEAERARALDAITERLVAGRGSQLRPTSDLELRQTAVLRVSLERASAKVRSGPPGDDEADHDWPVWAGVVPIDMTMGEPEPDTRLSSGITLPDNVVALRGKRP